MRKQFDRRVGDAVEFVVAARHRRVGVGPWTSVSPPVCARIGLPVHCEWSSAGFNQQEESGLVNSFGATGYEMVHDPWPYFCGGYPGAATFGRRGFGL